MPGPVLPVLRIEALRQAAVDRLRAAVVIAQGATPPLELQALAGLYIPKHRFEKLTPAQAPFAHVAAKTDGGEGSSHQVPNIDLVGTLHVNLFHACTRQNAQDLDRKAGEIANAIEIALLEDQDFIQRFSWVSGLRRTVDDGVARGADGAEYDCVMVQIELEVSGDQQTFEPRVTQPLRTIHTELALGDDAESIEGQSLVVKQTFPLEQE